MHVSICFNIDLTDPAILLDYIDYVEQSTGQAFQRMDWRVRTETEQLQNQINTLETRVESLLLQINEQKGWKAQLSDELNEWKAKIETQQGEFDQRLTSYYAEFTDKNSQVTNRLRSLDDVVLTHHPENYAALGYTISPPTEEVTESTPIAVEQAETIHHL